jgi:hypothetical protein
MENSEEQVREWRIENREWRRITALSSILNPQSSLENLRFSLASAFSEHWCEDGAATDAQQRPGFQ